AAQAAIVWALLRPVEVPAHGIDGDPDAPPGLILPFIVAAAGLDQHFDLRAVEVRAHHAHALAVAPVELATVLIEVELFRCVGDALRDDDLGVLAVEVGALDRAVAEVGDTNVGPIDVTSLDIHADAVGIAAIGDDGRAVGTIGIHRVNAVAA